MNPYFCTLDGRTPVISRASLFAAFSPFIKTLREDSAECGEGSLDDREWFDLLLADTRELLNREIANKDGALIKLAASLTNEKLGRGEIVTPKWIVAELQQLTTASPQDALAAFLFVTGYMRKHESPEAIMAEMKRRGMNLEELSTN